ncbi:transcriptional regulator [Mycoplasmopsis cynos]|uniref:hypothetical protein n=1 Tax=Mycoplasmopsis cynos TaxID=171284 RepID=UPI002B0007A1|nr:hypothetical protein [Mycoplasmopsis cynos]WQQ14374.1 hypothetical protein RRG42_02020 [Mycoplasmopsis cynos]
MVIKVFIWTLFGLFSLLLLVMFIFLIRKLILDAIHKKANSIKNKISILNNNNKTILQKVFYLSKNENKYLELLDYLKDKNNLIYDNITIWNSIYDKTNELLSSHKIIKSFLKLFKLKKIFKKIKFFQLQFDKRGSYIENEWSQIDVNFAHILEITQHIKENLNKKKGFLKTSFNYLDKKANNIRLHFDKINKLKYKGSFDIAKNESEKIISEINDIKDIFNSIEKIEFVMFYQLPLIIKSLKNYDNFDFYEKMNNQYLKLNHNWNRKSFLNIKNELIELYETIHKFKTTNFETFLLDSYLKRNKTFFNRIIKTFKGIIEKNKFVNNTFLNKIMETIKKLHNTLYNESLKNNQKIILIRQMLRLMLKMQQNLVIYHQINFYKINKTKLINDEYLKLSNLYFWTTQNDLLPANVAAEENVQFLNNLYQKKINNKIDFINNKKEYQEFIQKISLLIKIIYENREYKKMFEILQVFISKNKSLKSNSRLNNILMDCDIYLKNNNYKEAFKVLKDALKNS